MNYFVPEGLKGKWGDRRKQVGRIGNYLGWWMSVSEAGKGYVGAIWRYVPGQRGKEQLVEKLAKSKSEDDAYSWCERAVEDEIMAKPLPCPFCGSSDLHVGVQSAMAYGVQCLKCRAQLELGTPNHYPRELKTYKGSQLIDELHRLTLFRAVLKWNTRGGRYDSR